MVSASLHSHTGLTSPVEEKNICVEVLLHHAMPNLYY